MSQQAHSLKKKKDFLFNIIINSKKEKVFFFLRVFVSIWTLVKCYINNVIK